MKKFLTVYFIIISLIFGGIDIADAKKISHSSSGKIPKGGGYNKNNKVYFNVNSGIVYCPSGQELINNDKFRSGLPRYADVSCMVPDNNPPSISIGTPDDLNGTCTTNAYSTKIEDICDYGWTNKDIEFSIEGITDGGLGVKKRWYKVNGVEYPLGTSPVNFNFTEDGIYTVTIGAEDNSTHFLDNGTISNIGNIMEYTQIFRIDKFAPVLAKIPTINTNWKNVKPVISFNLKDSYKGVNIEIKSFSCSGNPENSKWVSPALNDGEIIGTCDPSIKNCSSDSNFSPNLSSCNWSCIDGYTKFNGQCYVNSKTETCDANLLSKNSYNYDKDDLIVLEGTETKSYWTKPDEVSTDGKFTSFFSNGNYSPSLSSCGFECKDGYHNESGDCVNNTALICCKADYPLITVPGVKVDCSIEPYKSTHLQCIYNELCGGYVKDVLKEWKSGSWVYTDGVLSGDDAASACGFQPIPNSNGETCNPGYYLTGSGTATPRCERVLLGEWSGQSNEKKSCTNKPSNSYYVEHTEVPLSGGNNDCPWVCNNNYKKNFSSCSAETKKDQTCTGLPDNAVWNTVNNIDQTWDGTKWAPSLVGTYNIFSSTTQCRFKCKSNYTWDGSQCKADIKINQACTGLPANATWNTVNNIDQTWDGTKWTPSLVGTYNIFSSTTQCRFKCKSNYTWDGSQCKADIKINQACTGLPANATWNTVNNIDQTWDGTKWAPSLIGTHNNTSSSNECRFKCDTNYSWDGFQCKASIKNDQSCTGLPANAEWNSVNKIDQTWDGTKWIPSLTGEYDENESTSECKFKCKTGKTWDGNSCK